MDGNRIDVSIIIPILDEMESLEDLVRELVDMMHGMRTTTFEVVFVDDGSTDGSDAVLAEATGTDPRFVVVRHRRNEGKSAALVTGFAVSRGGVLVTLDGDLQNPPAEIPRALAALEEGPVDVVVAVREARQDTWRIRAASRVGNSVRRWVLGDDVLDVGCGLNVFRRRMLDEIPQFEGLHRFLPAIWQARGARITQLPIEHRPRLHGRSKYSIHGRLWRGIADLLGVYWLIKRSIYGRQMGEERDE